MNRLTICLAFILMTYSCSSPEEKKKEWEPEIDQVARDSSGRITFARTHSILTRDKAMNKDRKNQMLELMRNTCPNKEFSLMRTYKTQSDFVTLKVDYRGNIGVVIYEFKCRN